MKKNTIALTLGIVYLALLIIGGSMVWKLQNNLNAMNTELHEVSQTLQQNEVALSKYQKEHGAAQLEMSELKNIINALTKKLEEQDRLVQSIGIQISQ